MILAEAAVVGDGVAADRYGVSARTVWRYRARAQTDPKLAALVSKRLASLGEDWARESSAFLLGAIAKLSTLIDQATVEQIHEVAGAIKIVGELVIMRDAINPHWAEPGFAASIFGRA